MSKWIEMDVLKLMDFSTESLDAQVEKIKVDKEKETLKIVFGEKTKIEKEKNGEWLVESILESRGIVSGGQKINVRLGKKTDLEIKEADYVFYDLYPLKEIKINDKKIKIPSETFFSPKRANRSTDNDTTSITDFEYKIFGNGLSGVTISNKQIILGGFQSAEDLVGLFHEFGHAKSKNPYKVGAENLNEKDIKTFLEFLKEENKASSEAITIIKNIRKSGVDLFPKDPNLTQVNLFLAMCISTFSKNLENRIDGERINNLEKFLKFD